MHTLVVAHPLAFLSPSKSVTLASRVCFSSVVFGTLMLLHVMDNRTLVRTFCISGKQQHMCFVAWLLVSSHLSGPAQHLSLPN